MANAATAQTAIPVIIPDSDITKVVPVVITVDTVDSDIIILSPAAGKHAALLGLQYAESDAHTLTIKDQGTTLVTYQLAADKGFSVPISKQPMHVTGEGNDLIFSVGTAVVSTMVAYVAEFDTLVL